MKIVWANAICATIVGLAGGFASYAMIRDQLHTEARAHEEHTIMDAAHIHNRMFEEIASNHQSAANQFRRQYAALDDDTARAVFETSFPRHGDGTRRSRPDLFDGTGVDNGAHVYGVGAFIGREAVGLAEQRALAAAYWVVSSAGPAHHASFDNLYFNNDRDTLIIYAPDRDDQLGFYRETAPADFQFADHEFVSIVTMDANPYARTACTHLTDLLYVEPGSALTIGCHTPVRVNGRQLGAFGTTLDVRAYLDGVLGATADGATTFIINRDGGLVAHPDLWRETHVDRARVDTISARYGLTAIAQSIADNGRQVGLLRAEAGADIVSFAKLSGPDWIVVKRTPQPLTHQRATGLAIGVGLVLACLVLIQLQLISTRPAAASGASAGWAGS
ncbi:MAG: hypothetical protein AAFX09_09645 [Pseudomonadota bacterium]